MPPTSAAGVRAARGASTVDGCFATGSCRSSPSPSSPDSSPHPPLRSRWTASRTAIISAGITSAGIAAAGRWEWPVDRFRLVAPYVQPADRYSAGHRGLDLQPIDGGAVLAPAPGIVAYAGTVADRPLVTIDHGDGLVTTLEPVTASRAGR